MANANVVSETVQGSVLIDKMAKMEEEKRKLKLYGERMELLYSQTTGRKNEYKDKVREMEKKLKESDKSHEAYKKETNEVIEKCKEETEAEKSLRLKFTIENHLKDKFAEDMEHKVDNLMREYEELRISKEEEYRTLKRSLENQLKEEKDKTKETSKKAQTLESENKKARDFFTKKMRERDNLAKEAENKRLDQVQIVINKESTIKNKIQLENSSKGFVVHKC